MDRAKHRVFVFAEIFSLVVLVLFQCWSQGVCVGGPVLGTQSRAEIRISEFCQLTGCTKSDEGLYTDIRYTGDENIRNFKCIIEFRINSYTSREFRLLMFQISKLKMSIRKVVMSAWHMYMRFILWYNSFVAADLAMDDCNITRINQIVSPGRKILGDINHLARCEDRGNPISPTANLKLLTKVASDFEKEGTTVTGLKRENDPKKKELQPYFQQQSDENFKSRKDKSLSSLCSKYVHLLFATKY